MPQGVASVPPKALEYRQIQYNLLLSPLQTQIAPESQYRTPYNTTFKSPHLLRGDDLGLRVVCCAYITLLMPLAVINPQHGHTQRHDVAQGERGHVWGLGRRQECQHNTCGYALGDSLITLFDSQVAPMGV